ncbi:MAG: enoyl-CoA hydratase/isomerase family protein [Deltaproteobacteria bacterium]|nr:enoyl-CoA hydratase/isomerase family protein [Deltaproteobacteria bacterium]MBW2448318.1 enoyl-CoA hydratase/isomerase family protein [Deltaproteobacteria bacterium]
MNRPDVLNALNRATLECLIARTDEIRADEGIRAVVLTGGGRAFVAGADISEMRGLSSAEATAFSRLGHRAMDGVESLPMPVIAAVNGFALGGGCELACACDWIYASSKARFGQPEVGLGLIPGFGGTSRLARRVGPGWVRELVMGGEPVKADVALQMGLVNRVCEPDELLDAALESASKAASKGPRAVASAKRVLLEGADADIRVAHALEQAAFGGVFGAEESAEGMDAFLEKRDPKF